MPKLIKLPTAREYEAWMGIRTAEQRRAILAIFRKAIRPLRAILKNRAAVYYAQYRDRHPCDSCALAVSTRRRRGFLATSFMFLKATRNQTPFMCHANQPGFKSNVIEARRLVICMGFALVADDPTVKNTAKAALAEVEQILAQREQEAS